MYKINPIGRRKFGSSNLTGLTGYIISIGACLGFYSNRQPHFQNSNQNTREKRHFSTNHNSDGLHNLATPNSLLILVGFALLLIVVVMIILMHRVSTHTISKIFVDIYKQFLTISRLNHQKWTIERNEDMLSRYTFYSIQPSLLECIFCKALKSPLG